MVYTNRLEIPLILDESFYENFHYICVSFGTHPCCYVEIPETHELYQKDFSDIEGITVHGCFTFSNFISQFSISETKNSWFIGWDYAHSGDYFYHEYDLPSLVDEHKYRTEELIQDCYNVIDQLNKFETRVTMYE